MKFKSPISNFGNMAFIDQSPISNFGNTTFADHSPVSGFGNTTMIIEAVEFVAG